MASSSSKTQKAIVIDSFKKLLIQMEDKEWYTTRDYVVIFIYGFEESEEVHIP